MYDILPLLLITTFSPLSANANMEANFSLNSLDVICSIAILFDYYVVYQNRYSNLVNSIYISNYVAFFLWCLVILSLE